MKLKFNLFSKKSSLHTLLSARGVGYHMNPVRDWTIGLTIATVSFLIGVALIGFDFYIQMSKAPNQEVVIEEKPLQYKESDVTRYAQIYAEKANTFNRLRAEKPSVPEPVEKEAVDEVTPVEPLPLAEPAEEQYTDPVPTLAP